MAVHSHSDGRRTDYRIEADALDEVEDAIVRIEANFHPLGYGTTFGKPEQRADGSWMATGYRYNSCD